MKEFEIIRHVIKNYKNALFNNKSLGLSEEDILWVYFERIFGFISNYYVFNASSYFEFNAVNVEKMF